MSWNPSNKLGAIVSLGAVVFTLRIGTAVAGTGVAKLTPSDASLRPVFGSPVAADGNDFVVAAPIILTTTASVFVFERVGMDWIETAKLNPSEPAFSDAFGASVAIDGDLLVAGAPHIDPLGSGFGFAYVFRRQGNTWIQETKLVSSGSQVNDSFGSSVSIDGELIVVGAAGQLTPRGQAYVFRREGMTWVQEAVLDSGGPPLGDGFGTPVSIRGKFLIVGATNDDDACPADPFCSSGAAYVFRREGMNWIRESKLVANDPAADDRFGNSVSISGGVVVVGASRKDDAGSNSGAAYVFRRNGGAWVRESKLTASDAAAGDKFGRSVAVEGDVILVGAVEADARAGAVYVFRYDGTTWIESEKLFPRDTAPVQFLGASVAMTADFALVGASGAAYVFLLADHFPDIPAASTWGMIILAVLLLTGATIVLHARRGRLLLLTVSSFAVAWTLTPGHAHGQLPDFAAPHHPEHLLVRFKPATTEQARQQSHSAVAGAELRRFRHIAGLTLVRAGCPILRTSEGWGTTWRYGQSQHGGWHGQASACPCIRGRPPSPSETPPCPNRHSLFAIRHSTFTLRPAR